MPINKPRKPIENASDAQRDLTRTLYRQSVSKDALAETAEAETLRCHAWKLQTALTGEWCVDQQCTKEIDDLVIYTHA